MRGQIGKVLGAAAAAALLLSVPAGASPRHANFRRDNPVQPPNGPFTPPQAGAAEGGPAMPAPGGSEMPPQGGPAMPAPVGPPGYADFHGQTLNLANSWGAANACAAFANGATECFANLAAMKATLALQTPPPAGQDALTPQSAAPGGRPLSPQARHRAALLRRRALRTPRARLAGRATYCQGQSWEWLYLYANANYGGRVLALQDTSYWYTLSNFGFANTMSSWYNATACTSYAAQNFSGGIWVTMGAWGSSAWVGNAANDKANYAYIS